MKIEITSVMPADDWVIVKVDGREVHAGHEIPDFTWIKLLEQAGANVSLRKVSAHALGVCSYDCPECETEFIDPFADQPV